MRRQKAKKLVWVREKSEKVSWSQRPVTVWGSEAEVAGKACTRGNFK